VPRNCIRRQLSGNLNIFSDGHMFNFVGQTFALLSEWIDALWTNNTEAEE